MFSTHHSLSPTFLSLSFLQSCFAPVLTDAQTLVGLVGLFGIDLSMLSNEASYLSILSNFCPGYTETKSCHTGTPTAIYGGPTSTPTKSSYGGPTTTKRPSPVPTINYDLLSKDCKKYYNNAGNSFKNIASICKMPKGYQTAEQQIAKAFYGSYSSANPPSKSQYDGILTKVDALLAPYCNKKGKCMTVLNGDLNNVQQKVRKRRPQSVILMLLTPHPPISFLSSAKQMLIASCLLQSTRLLTRR